MKKLFLVFVASLTIVFSCSKDDPSAPLIPGNTKDTTNQTKPPTDTTLPPPVTRVSPSIYIAGDGFDASTRILTHAILWENGKPVRLPDAGRSSGNGIAVLGSDVYVSGEGIDRESNVTIWKNNIGIYLIDSTIGNPSATGITVSGNDVYTVGYAALRGRQKTVPVYWKNQEPAVKIATPSLDPGYGRGIAVSGNDVYIAGTAIDPSLYKTPPCYWKNGTPTFLGSSTTKSVKGLAKSIFISGSDVHVVGDIYGNGGGLQLGTATYWKNGKATELTPPNEISEANCVIVVGSDVYIAGTVMGANGTMHATYWKNGVAVTLDTKYSEAKGITVYGNDVYVVGNRGSDSALFWKNGTPVVLGRGRANAIVVKQ